MTPYYGQLSDFVSCHIRMEILLMMAQPIVLSLKKLPHPISSKYQFVKPDDIVAFITDTSVLLENTPPVKFIRNHIWDSGGTFSTSSLLIDIMFDA